MSREGSRDRRLPLPAQTAGRAHSIRRSEGCIGVSEGGGGRRWVSVSERGQAWSVSSHGSRHGVVESGDGTANRLDVSSGDGAATNGPPTA